MSKKIFHIICTLLLLFTITFILGCSEVCDGEDPSVVLFNNGLTKADIQIKTSGGNTENINNIQPGEYSEKRYFSPGLIEFTVAVQGIQENLEYTLTADYCTEYAVSINSDSTVTGTGKKLGKVFYP